MSTELDCVKRLKETCFRSLGSVQRTVVGVEIVLPAQMLKAIRDRVDGERNQGIFQVSKAYSASRLCLCCRQGRIYDGNPIPLIPYYPFFDAQHGRQACRPSPGV